MRCSCPRADRIPVKRDKGEEKPNLVFFMQNNAAKLGSLLPSVMVIDLLRAKVASNPDQKFTFWKRAIPIGDYMPMKESSVLGVFHPSEVKKK